MSEVGGESGGSMARQPAVRAAARMTDPDRYLAALLAPPAVAPDLLVLAAFSGEIARIPETVGEPAAALLRLAWWRDAIERCRLAPSERTGNPVADALIDLAARARIEPADAAEAIEARDDEIAIEPFETCEAFSAYLDRAEGSVLRMEARVRGIELAPVATMIGIAGRALGVARLSVRLPRLIALGRCPVPSEALREGDPRRGTTGEAQVALRGVNAWLVERARSDLARLRSGLEAAPRSWASLFLTAALIESYLRAVERPGRDILRTSATIAPLARIWTLWRAHCTGRV